MWVLRTFFASCGRATPRPREYPCRCSVVGPPTRNIDGEILNCSEAGKPSAILARTFLLPSRGTGSEKPSLCNLSNLRMRQRCPEGTRCVSCKCLKATRKQPSVCFSEECQDVLELGDKVLWSGNRGVTAFRAALFAGV